MGVSRSGFYAWRNRPVSARAVADTALSSRIAAIHAASRGSYGAPGVRAELAEQGIHVCRKHVERLMKVSH
jgi:putative transposase